jgi:hypothetical protein
MRRAWDPQQPVETLFKQIQDCAEYSEAGGVLIGHPQQINVGRNQPMKKLGHNSNPTLQPLTVSTSKCKENSLPQPGSTLQMPL